MQLVTYSRLNAVLYSARQSIVFHFDIPLHAGRLARDNEYGYLTGSSNVNKAASFQASARRSFGVKISRYERQMLVGKFRERSFSSARARARTRSLTLARIIAVASNLYTANAV